MRLAHRGTLPQTNTLTKCRPDTRESGEGDLFVQASTSFLSEKSDTSQDCTRVNEDFKSCNLHVRSFWGHSRLIEWGDTFV